MRVLLLHPEDEFPGPRKKPHWDWIIDLGLAPRSFYDSHSATLGCPVSSIHDFAVEFEDLQVWQGLLSAGMGQVVDEFGLDWWEIIGLLLQSEMQDVRLAVRLANKLGTSCTLAASRPALLADAVRLQLEIPLTVFQAGIRPRVQNRVARYRAALTNLSFGQLKQVAHDKYDPHYRWRRKFASKIAPASDPTILLPSAYSNVTKTALNYARVLPKQKFLLVLARESGAVSPLPNNVKSAPLASYAEGEGDPTELRELEKNWLDMEKMLAQIPEYRPAVRLGIVRKGVRFLTWGLPIRDAWNKVFEKNNVIGCLSADDSNPYTRLPLMLALRRGIPAVACHHGALDARMAFKVPRFSTYLAQGEMERDYLQRICGVDPAGIRVGAARATGEHRVLWSSDAPWITLFTEPYETDLWRTEAIYREVLPPLCAAARKAGKTVVLKLHPFENLAHRRRLVRAAISQADQKQVHVTDKSLSPEILRNTWCAVTVESTVAFECADGGIPVFLCGWLRHAYSGYALQYARFGVGRILKSAADLANIPGMIEDAMPGPGVASQLVQAISPDALGELLTRPIATGMAK